jgi:hypothetical protein
MCEDNPKSNNERLVLAHDDITTKPLGERSQQNVAAKQAKPGEPSRRAAPLISDGKKLRPPLLPPRLGRYPPSKAGPPPSYVARKRTPPSLPPPSKFKKFRREAMSHELGLPKRREFRLELSESRRSVPGWTGTSARGRGCARLSVRVAMCEDNPKSNNERLVLAHDDSRCGLAMVRSPLCYLAT